MNFPKQSSRRRFIAAALSATVVTAGQRARSAAPPAGGPPGGGPPGGAGRGGFSSAPPATDIRTEFRKVGASTWAFLQREAPGQSNFSVSNFGIIEGPKSLLAIDGGGAPQHARNFIAAARTLGKPIDRVVITHEHPDHSTGLTQFPEGIEIIAQEETRGQMSRMRAPTTPDYWKTNPAWGNASDVNRVVMPTMTFRERMSVYYGDTRVDFVWPGRAHTVGDALIFVRSERVVFLGDIGFFGVTPLSASGFMTEWIALCDAVLADPAAEILVPGHGPVGGKNDLREMRDYLALLMREGRKAFDAGVSAADAAARIDLGKYATWTDADRVTANMNRLYNEFRGTYDSETDREATRHALAEYARLQAR